jgi:hypothetical protein
VHDWSDSLTDRHKPRRTPPKDSPEGLPRRTPFGKNWTQPLQTAAVKTSIICEAVNNKDMARGWMSTCMRRGRISTSYVRVSAYYNMLVRVPV